MSKFLTETRIENKICFSGTRYLEVYRSERKIPSLWCFIVKHDNRIFLRYGWTSFGVCRETNNFIILDDDFQSVEFRIFIQHPASVPQIIPVANNLLFNGYRRLTAGQPFTVNDREQIEVTSGPKSIILKFMYNKS